MGKTFRCAILLSLLAVSSISQAQQSEPVSNPVWNANFPDPTMWKGEDGNFYAVATGVSKLIKSPDLKHWQDTGERPVSEQDFGKMHSIAKAFWAPDVTTVNGQRLMYLTLYNRAEDSNIAVLKETGPGHFEYHGIITRGVMTGIDDTIDPEVVTDGSTGKVWMFFGSVGGVYRVELTDDGLSVRPGSCYVHVAGVKISEDGTRKKVFEGSYLHHHGRYWYLFVSSGNYWDHTYALYVGRSERIDGIYRDKEGREMAKGFASPVLCSGEGDYFYGPGHCGEIHAGADGKEYISYHCHTKGIKPGERAMLIDEIMWDSKGWPFCKTGKPARTVE